MRPAFLSSLRVRRPELLTRRAVGITLVIIVHLLAFLLGYLMAPPLALRKADDAVKDFSLIRVFDKVIAPKPRPQGHKAPIVHMTPRAVQPRSEVVAPPSPLKMMIVSSDVFAASDISQIKSQGPPTPSGGPTGSGGETGDGEGPGGAPLYNAEWYREPTDAEMSYYFPKSGPRSGWGMIICKSAPDYRVEDCREIAESPPGVGIARTMREAAWQFRIRPPRIGGKSLIGAWIRIRYDVTVGFKK